MSAIQAASFWSAWQPASCLPDGCFCEAIRQGVIAQPANFWSSFAFVMAAVLIWAVAKTLQQRFYAATLAMVGVGSACYHGSLTFAGQVADMTGMFAVATFAILFALERSGRISRRAFVVWFFAGNTLLALAQVEFPDARRYVFAVLIAGALTAERGSGTIYLRRAVMALGIGFAFWVVDKLRLVCAPESFLQGHAVWHLAGALAGWLLYLHYRISSALRGAA